MEAVAELSWVTLLREGRWSYAAVNAAHILGIALLVGAVVPLDLRLLGAWPSIAVGTVARLLVPMAMFGLALAASTGLVLFSVRATEYIELRTFTLKMVLIGAGATSACVAHANFGLTLDRAGRRSGIAVALVSIGCWLGALACGRLLAFVGD